MPFYDPVLEQKRQQRFGGGTVAPPSVSGSTQLQTQTTGFTDPIIEQKRQQLFSQPRKFKGVSGTQFQVTKPIEAPRVPEQKLGLLTKAKALGESLLVKNIDFKKLGQSIIGGAKTFPGQAKIASGVILQGIINQNKFVEQFFSSLRPQRFKEEQEKGITELELVAQKLRESGVRASTKARQEHFEVFEPSDGLQGYLEMAAFNIPQMAATTGLSLATVVVTKNPFLAGAVGVSSAYGLGASEVYETARANGLSDKEALPMSQFGGAIIGGIDFIPMGRLIRKTGVVEPVKKTIVKKIASGIVSLGIQSGFEGITEGVQEIVGNAIASTYKENQDLLEGVKESIFVGALLGGFADVTTSGAIGALNRKAQPAEVLKNIDKKIEGAIQTAPNKRTTEQKQIVKAIITNDLTPGEATGYVIDNKLEKTDEGKQIMKLVVQAQEEGQNIRIELSENEKDATVKLVSPEEPIKITPLEAEKPTEPGVGEGRGVAEIPQELKSLAQEVKQYKSEAEFVSSSIFNRSLSGIESKALAQFDGETTADKLTAFYKQITQVKKPKKPPTVKQAKKAFARAKKQPFSKEQRQTAQKKVRSVIFGGESPEVAQKNIKALFKEEVSVPEKPQQAQRLKALRAEANRNMFEFVGADTGNWTRDFAFFQSLKDDTELSPILNEIEEGILAIDEAIGKSKFAPATTAPSGFADVGGYGDIKSVEKSIEDIKSVEMPELVRIVRSLSGETPTLKKFRKSLGAFYALDNGLIKFDPEIFKNPELAAKVMAHELGHMTDWLETKTMARGNLVGRVATLNKHLKRKFGNLDNKVLKKELKALSRKWKPFDEGKVPVSYTKYRYSAKELYADAISVLFNDPVLLKQEAPTFYNQFFAYLDKKPTVKDNFFKVWNLLNSGEEAEFQARDKEL